MAYALGWAWCLSVSAMLSSWWSWALTLRGCQCHRVRHGPPQFISDWTPTLWLQMENHIAAGNPYKAALGINSAHCCSVYLGCHLTEHPLPFRHILYLFRLQSSPHSKMAFVFPWVWKSESTLVLCGFKLKESVIAFIFCTHRGMENTEKSLQIQRLHHRRSLSMTSVLILRTKEWLPACAVEDLVSEWTGCTQENQLLNRMVMERKYLVVDKMDVMEVGVGLCDWTGFAILLVWGTGFWKGLKLSGFAVYCVCENQRHPWYQMHILASYHKHLSILGNFSKERANHKIIA